MAAKLLATDTLARRVVGRNERRASCHASSRAASQPVARRTGGYIQCAPALAAGLQRYALVLQPSVVLDHARVLTEAGWLVGGSN